MPITGGGGGTTLPRGLRARYADFLADVPVLAGTSITRRPDAIAFDYLTAFTVGPVALGDPSGGIVSWVWRCRVAGLTVYLARETATRDGWEAEVAVFAFGGIPIDEVDCCFDQNGQPIIVAERATALWIYYNDLTLGGYGFRAFGAGRTPRAVLDDPLDVNGSDVLVFYVDPALGMVYRQQRERYAVVRPTPIVGAAPIVPLLPPMNYGPVLFRGGGLTDVGDLVINATYWARAYYDPGEPTLPTARFTVGNFPGSVAAILYFSRPVFGFSLDQGNAAFDSGGSVLATDGVTTGVLVPFADRAPGDPYQHAIADVPGGFTELHVARPPGDHQAWWTNLRLRLDDATLLTVAMNVCAHGPVVFDGTGDPLVLAGTVDGITVEARSASGAPGVFRPMAWADIERPYGWRHDPDGWRIQTSPIVAAQLTTGDNRPTPGTTLTLTFSSVVSGIEVEGVGTIDADNRIIAYDALGAVLGSIEPTPPVAYAAYTNRYAIYAPGIKTVALVAAVGAVYPNGLSWTALTFRKPGDVPVPPTGMLPPLPSPPIADLFLEDAVRTPDNRVSVLYAVRDSTTGTYSFGRIDTVLYPFRAPYGSEAMTGRFGATGGAIFQFIHDALARYDGEGMTASYGGRAGGVLLTTVVPPTGIDQPYDGEGMIEQYGCVGGSLYLAIHDHAQFHDGEAMTGHFGTRPGSALTLVIYDHAEPYGSEGMTGAYGALPGSTLVIP